MKIKSWNALKPNWIKTHHSLVIVCSGISVWASVESEIEALGDGESSGDRSCGEGEWSGGDGDRSDRLFIKQLLLFKIRCQFQDAYEK